MKQIKRRWLICVFLFIIAVLSVVCSIQILNASAESDNTVIVYTPKGSPVELHVEGGSTDNSEYWSVNTFADDHNIEAVALAPKSGKYNCHSYAWYQQTTTNEYYLYDPSPYYEDGSYIEVSSPQVGDIICYFDENGDNDHSAVIVEVDNSKSDLLESLTVVSKWGPQELYKHRADNCIYMRFTAYTRIFRNATMPYSHEHAFGFRHEQIYEEVAEEQYVSNVQCHNIHCICGDYITQAHTYRYGDITETGHTKSCECGYSDTEVHEYTKSINKNTAYHSKKCACGATVDELHEYGDNEYEYVNKQNHRRRCEVCNTYVLSRHAIKASEGYDHCAYCGCALDRGEYYPALPNAQNRTPNGSYILPNGIIVLVDEDIEAYENGTLKFYSDLPEVQIS